MDALPGVGNAVERLLATAQNGLEVLRYGGLETGTQPAPFRVVETEKMFRLRRYFPDDPGVDAPHIVLIPPMMVSANVYDVTEQYGAVSVLYRHGIIPWVVDFGSPDEEEGGMERTLADHVVAVNRVIDLVHSAAGRDIHVGGYSQGGMFAYQAVAYRRSAGVASVITWGSPVDVTAALPLGLPASLVVPGAELLADKVFTRLWVPGWLARTGFQALDPVKTARSRIDFLRKLHDRDALLTREDQRRFIEADGWVAWSGPAVAELLRQFVVHNRMVSGGFVIQGDLVTLSEVTCPVLIFVGETDDIGQPLAVRGIRKAAPHAEIYETTLPVGHFGLVVGSSAGRMSWPNTAEWVRWQEKLGDRPEMISPVTEEDAEGTGTGISIAQRLSYATAQVAGTSTAVSRGVLHTVNALQRTTVAVAQESVRTLPRLFRLGQIQASTRISLGKLMSENQRRSPQGELFLFENRVLTHEQVNTRIDNVVAGLIHCGVRPGQHIGVLMETRPSALVVIAALSRLGAVSVLLSAADEIAEMMRSTDTGVVVTDPDNLAFARAHCDRVLVLGGGSGDAREIEDADGISVVDMEQVDPDAVDLPSWYRPDPGLAGDLAFILFTRSSGGYAAWPVSNHRFAQSAFGAASAAGLTSGDTVYCLPPLHHASGLLTTLGATVAGRSRIALSTAVNPEQFVTEVHRYGVTVVSYTWTMLGELVRSEDFDMGHHNPIRLFMGSGMPAGIWRDVQHAFPQTNVLEFFATADGSVILADVAGRKIGCMGQALPETNQVKVAAFDPITEVLEVEESGFVREAPAGEVGLLLAQSRNRFEAGSTMLRDVFATYDRWEVSGYLFERDEHGDLWFMGGADSVIKTADGPVYAPPIEQALSELVEVSRVVVYGVGEPDRQFAVAAIELRGNPSSITPPRLRGVLGGLPADRRPHLIRIVDEIPLSDSYRPLAAGFSRTELPKPGPGTWYRDRESGGYRRYTRNAAAKLGW